MVNTNIQGVIPIDGRGFTAKNRRVLDAGEYSVLSNMRIEDNILQSRHNVFHYAPEGTVSPPLVDPFPFVGFVGPTVVVASKNAQLGCEPGTAHVAMWLPTALPTDGNANSFNKIVGVFEYNKIWFWLTWRYDHTTGLSAIWAYSKTSVGNVFKTTTFASLTPTLLFSITSTTFNFNNFFIFKERLWISTADGLYFSKATDPLTFAVPNGGFFKIRDQIINFSFSSKDNIYITCNSTISVLSYTTDPNVDSYLREVTNSMGAETGCSLGDQAYVGNYDGVYAISPNSVELVRDDFETIKSHYTKLVSWEKYLIVIKYKRQFYQNTGLGLLKHFNIGRSRYENFWPLKDLVDSSVWFIDTLTGACHTLDFNDQYSGTGIEVFERGHITDIIFSNNFLTYMTTKASDFQPSSGTGHVYYTTSSMDTGFGYDTAVNNPVDNVVRRMKPNIKIEFSSYTPDGNEYMMKKFRSLEVMGVPSFWEFEGLIAYDNNAYDEAKAFNFTYNLTGATDARAPFPSRIALNQRARAINIFFRTKNPRVPMTDPNIYERVEFSDLRVLWTYTGRGPTHQTQSPTT